MTKCMMNLCQLGVSTRNLGKTIRTVLENLAGPDVESEFTDSGLKYFRLELRQ